MVMIRVSRFNFNNSAPVINGVPQKVPVGVPFDASAELIEVLTRAGVVFERTASTAPTAKTGTASASGVVYTAQRLLESTSVFSLVTGSSSNLSINSASGAISAASAIAVGASQTANVREANNGLAVEYPVVITGVDAAPTPAPSPTLTITSTHAERRVYGLTDLAELKVAGGMGATASVGITGSYTGAPTVIQARSVDYTSGAQVTPWTTIVASPSGGTFAGTLPMAEYEGWQRIEVRGDTTSVAATATTTRIGAGVLVGWEGQSQSRYLATNVDNSTGSSAYTPDDLTSVYAQDGMLIATSGEDYSLYTDVAWHYAGETYTKSGKTFLAGGGAGVAEAGKVMRSALKVPVGFIVNAIGGVGLDVLNASPAQPIFAARYNEAGRPHYVGLMMQGGNDLGASEATYTTRLNNWRAWHTANIAYTPRRKFMISPLARRQTGSNVDIVNIRRPQMAHIDANASDTIFAGWGYDVSLADAVHQDANGNALHGRRFASAIVNDIIGTGVAFGPTITNVARSGANVSLTVAFNGGTALEANDTTASAGTLTAAAFEVTRNSDSAAQTINSITASGNTITLTLSADPGSAVSVRYGAAASPGGKALADNTRIAGLTRGAVIRPLLTALAEASSALSVSGSPGNRSVGDSAAFAPTISGGVAPYTVSLLSGTLPPGRTLANNTITGTYTTAGSYSYTLRVTDSANPAATADLAVTQTIAAASTLKTAKVNIGANTSTADGFSQNSYTGRTTAGTLALKDVSGAATGWTMTTTTAFGSSNATGGFQPATPNSGIVPDDVLASYFTSNSARGAFNLAGLNPAKTYKLTLVPSRNSTGSRNVLFTVNGALTQTVDADRNATLAAVFNAVAPDANGNITIAVDLGSGNTTAHYINALIIEESA